MSGSVSVCMTVMSHSCGRECDTRCFSFLWAANTLGVPGPSVVALDPCFLEKLAFALLASLTLHLHACAPSPSTLAAAL